MQFICYGSYRIRVSQIKKVRLKWSTRFLKGQERKGSRNQTYGFFSGREVKSEHFNLVILLPARLLSSCLSFKIPYICNPKMKIPRTNYRFQFWRQLRGFGILNAEFSLPDVVKLVDTSDLGSDAVRYGGSNPSIRTNKGLKGLRGLIS